MNRKDRRGNKTTYLSGNTGIRLICEAVAVELLFYAMLAIFRSAFGWQLPIRALGKLQVSMLVSLVLFIVGVPATGKYQRVCKVVLEIGYPAALVLFGIFHRRKLTESGKMLFQAYLSYWNKQYGTNYMTGTGTEMRYTYMLAFLLAVVVLLSLMFRYVTGVRLVLLLPDITALSVALLVNARLGWSGIALFFVGTVLVSAAPWTHMDAATVLCCSRCVCRDSCLGEQLCVFRCGKADSEKVTEVLCVSETGGRTCEKPDVFGDNFAGIAGTCG